MAEEFQHLSLDMCLDVLREWLLVNELAGATFDRLPGIVQQTIIAQPAGWISVVPALAAVDPSLREMGHVMLAAAIKVLEEQSGSLSYPGATMVPKTGAESGVGMDLADVAEARIQRIEDRLDHLEELMELVAAALSGASGVLSVIPSTTGSGREASASVQRSGQDHSRRPLSA